MNPADEMEVTNENVENESSQTIENEAPNGSKNALEDNISQKGRNAYYYAHSHKASGPKWDATLNQNAFQHKGNIEPKLLGRQTSEISERSSIIRQKSFDYRKNNITSYAFTNDGKHVKIYVQLDGIGEKCTDEDIQLEFTESSFNLTIANYEPNEVKRLGFTKLYDFIDHASYKKKKNKVILSLLKRSTKKITESMEDCDNDAEPSKEPETKEWPCIGASK